MKRYRFLKSEDIEDAINRLGNAFLAAKNGRDVDRIIYGLLTSDERLKIGRRILVAEFIREGMTFKEISKHLKVGKNTIQHVYKLLDRDEGWINLIEKRNDLVNKEYKKKKYIKKGGSNLIFKPKVYSRFSKKEVKR